MNLRLPKDVLKWLDEVRGTRSRQAFIVALLVHAAKAHNERKQ